MIRGDDGIIRYPPHWMWDFRASFHPLDNIVHNTSWKWLRRWWYRRSWSRIYPIQDGMVLNRLGWFMIHELLKDGSMDYRKFTAMLFLCQKRVLEATGESAGIPFLWGMAEMGPMPGVFVIG